MRILITGATGNVGRGATESLTQAGHEVVLYDIVPMETNLPFFQGDLRDGSNLNAAAEGCELIVHSAAWHGIHFYSKSELDYWQLNVNGTFHVFQAAVQQKVRKAVYLSSVVYYWPWSKYGFTKKVGEDLCEYYWRNHQIPYIALRPGDFTPWKEYAHYVQRFLYGGVDRRDVIQSVRLAVENETLTNEWFNIQAECVFAPDDLAEWEKDPFAVVEKRFPGKAELLRKYNINIGMKPAETNVQKTKDLLGWRPQHNFGTVLDELARLDQEGTVSEQRCDY